MAGVVAGSRGGASTVDAKTNFGNEGAIFFLPRGLHVLLFFLPHDLFSVLPHDLHSRVICAGASGGVELRLGREIGRVGRGGVPSIDGGAGDGHAQEESAVAVKAAAAVYCGERDRKARGERGSSELCGSMNLVFLFVFL